MSGAVSRDEIGFDVAPVVLSIVVPVEMTFAGEYTVVLSIVVPVETTFAGEYTLPRSTSNTPHAS